MPRKTNKERDRLEQELTYAQAAVLSLKDRFLVYASGFWLLRHYRATPADINHNWVPEDICLGDTFPEALDSLTRLYAYAVHHG